jgi:ADP-heptose:LPS heptosyltransferase
VCGVLTVKPCETINCYDALFAGFDAPSEYKRPNAFLHPSELAQFEGWKYILIQPFSASELRSLSPAVFERVLEGAGEVAKKRGLKLVVVHNRQFEPEITAAIQRHDAIGSADVLTLRQYMAIVSRADAVVSVDSSAYHLAAAFGRPTVTLWGSFDPDSRSKYYPRQRAIWHKHLCSFSPCWHQRDIPADKCPKGSAQRSCECNSGVTSEEVSAALEKLLA